jgi:hypothetical protein
MALCAAACATSALAQDVTEETDETEQTDPVSGIDWSVALRGSYAANTVTGGHAGLSVAPEVSLTLGGESSLSRLNAGSEVIVNGAGQARISDLHVGAESSFRLGATTVLDGAINGSLTQADPDDSGLPANTLTAPLVLDGTVRGSVTQDFDKIDMKLTLDGERLVKGPTTLDDLSTIDNAPDSYWQGGATLRVGYELTPLVSAFVEGEASVQKFDAPSPTLFKYLDGRTYQLRTGLSYVQGSVILAEASVGYAWLDYFDGTLTDTQSWVYNGKLTYKPDETLSLVGSLETTLGPSANVPGDTDVGYALEGEARYQVNPWLTLRGSAGWNQTVTLGTNDISWGYDAGAGLDYQTSRHVVWSADYLYSRDYAPPSPVSDTHTVTVGVKVQR